MEIGPLDVISLIFGGQNPGLGRQKGRYDLATGGALAGIGETTDQRGQRRIDARSQLQW